jgi:glycosyltransferase involved in cell wall biosynthesis
MEGRATLLENEIDLAGVRDLMAASDLFLSLPTFTDMRSLSNLQAAACGAVPIISNQEEVRRMIADGFRAQLVDPTQPEEIAAAIAAYLDAPELVESTRHANAAYLEQHEDHEANLDRMLAAIVEVCRSRR